MAEILAAADEAIQQTAIEAAAEAVIPLLAELQVIREQQARDFWAGAAVGAGVGLVGGFFIGWAVHVTFF